RLGVGQHAQPAEGIDALVEPDRLGRHRGARHAVEAVAAGDEVAVDAYTFFIQRVINSRGKWFDVKNLQCDIARPADRLAARRRARRSEVRGGLGLAVHRAALPGEALEGDAAARAAEDGVEAVVPKARGLATRADTGALQERYRAAFE